MICRCSCGWPVHTDFAISLECPQCKDLIACSGEPQPSISEPSRVKNRWLPLHQYPVDHASAWNADAAREWYATWLSKVPNINCSCRANWTKYTESNPPPFDSASEFLDWSIIAHDHVSTQHVTPPREAIGLERGRKLWLGPKVAFISTTYKEIGGTETFHRSLLSRLRMHVNIIGFACTYQDGGDPNLLGVPYTIGEQPARELANKADIVIVWGVGRLGDILKDCTAKVIAVHHADPSSDWSNNLILDQLQYIDEAVCVNASTAEYIAKEGRLKTHWIPNAVEPARCIPTPAASELRDRYGLAGERIVFWCARCSAEKQPRLAVEIARQLPAGWSLVMAGDGALLAACRRAAKGLRNIRFLGAIDHPGDWLSIADRFVSMSTYEGFGLSMAEAIVAGVPVVATPKGIALDPRLATQVDANAPAREWVDAIVAEQPLEKIQLAHQVYSEQYSIDDFLAQWINVLKV